VRDLGEYHQLEWGYSEFFGKTLSTSIILKRLLRVGQKKLLGCLNNAKKVSEEEIEEIKFFLKVYNEQQDRVVNLEELIGVEENERLEDHIIDAKALCSVKDIIKLFEQSCIEERPFSHVFGSLNEIIAQLNGKLSNPKIVKLVERQKTISDNAKITEPAGNQEEKEQKVGTWLTGQFYEYLNWQGNSYKELFKTMRVFVGLWNRNKKTGSEINCTNNSIKNFLDTYIKEGGQRIDELTKQSDLAEDELEELEENVALFDFVVDNTQRLQNQKKENKIHVFGEFQLRALQLKKRNDEIDKSKEVTIEKRNEFLEKKGSARKLRLVHTTMESKKDYRKAVIQKLDGQLERADKLLKKCPPSDAPLRKYRKKTDDAHHDAS